MSVLEGSNYSEPMSQRTFVFDGPTVQALTTLTAQLVEMRMRRTDAMLCTENIGPEIFGKLLSQLLNAGRYELAKDGDKT